MSFHVQSCSHQPGSPIELYRLYQVVPPVFSQPGKNEQPHSTVWVSTFLFSDVIYDLSLLLFSPLVLGTESAFSDVL